MRIFGYWLLVIGYWLLVIGGVSGWELENIKTT